MGWATMTVPNEIAELNFQSAMGQERPSTCNKENDYLAGRRPDKSAACRGLFCVKEMQVGQVHPSQVGVEIPWAQDDQVQQVMQACLIAVRIGEGAGTCRRQVSASPRDGTVLQRTGDMAMQNRPHSGI